MPGSLRSMPVKISPKPASMAPSDRVLPRATSQRKAPTSMRGRAAAAILKRRPKIATSQIVDGRQPYALLRALCLPASGGTVIAA